MDWEKVNAIRLELQSRLAGLTAGRYGFVKIINAEKPYINEDGVTDIYQDSDGFFLVFDKSKGMDAHIKTEGEVIDIPSPRASFGIVRASGDYDISIRHAEYVKDVARKKKGLDGATSEMLGELDKFDEAIENPSIPKLSRAEREKIIAKYRSAGIGLEDQYIEEYYPIVKREYLFSIIRKMKSAGIGTTVLVRGPPDNIYAVTKTADSSIRLIKLEFIYNPQGEFRAEVEKAVEKKDFTRDKLRQRWPDSEWYGFKVINDLASGVSDHGKGNRIILAEIKALNNIFMDEESTGPDLRVLADKIAGEIEKAVRSEIEAGVKVILGAVKINGKEKEAIDIVDGLTKTAENASGNIVNVYDKEESGRRGFETKSARFRELERKKFQPILENAYKEWGLSHPLKGVTPLKGVEGKVCVIGDIRGNPSLFREILEGLSLIKKGADENGLEDEWIAKEGTNVVQIGNSVSQNMGVYEYLVYINEEAEKKYGRVIRVFGSNKFSYCLRHTDGKWLRVLMEKGTRGIEGQEEPYSGDELEGLIRGSIKGAIVFESDNVRAVYPLNANEDGAVYKWLTKLPAEVQDTDVSDSVAEISVNLLKPEQPGGEYRPPITENAHGIFHALGNISGADEWPEGFVVLNLGSGTNPIIGGKFINIDDADCSGYGGRFFKANYLKRGLIDGLRGKGELEQNENVRAVFLHNTWFFVPSSSEGTKIKYFSAIWNDVVPDGGDFVFVDYMAPGRLEPAKNQEIVLGVEKLIKGFAGDNIEKITRIRDAKTGYIIGLAVRKKGQGVAGQMPSREQADIQHNL
ncbi:MAG: hypothetical protein Q8O12_00920 [Candidatus Omnitrophota bacterium]|nr:hypothetical protein [Candidatus Omnitrophota bacterium]